MKKFNNIIVSKGEYLNKNDDMINSLCETIYLNKGMVLVYEI